LRALDLSFVPFNPRTTSLSSKDVVSLVRKLVAESPKLKALSLARDGKEGIENFLDTNDLLAGMVIIQTL